MIFSIGEKIILLLSKMKQAEDKLFNNSFTFAVAL